MSTQVSTLGHKTAKPVVAGIFNIVIGSGCMLVVLVLGVIGIIAMPGITDFPYNAGIILWLLALPLAAIGIVSIIGGICCLQRRMWGWALAGSILTAFISTVLGIVSIVLVAVSRDEFVQ